MEKWQYKVFVYQLNQISFKVKQFNDKINNNN